MSSINISPQVHWPFSGSVTQDIHPSLLARAGSDETEARVLRDVASYGKQIGVLSDVVLALADALKPRNLGEDGAYALGQLRDMIEEIALVKKGARPLPTSEHAAQELVDALRERFPGIR